MRKLTLLFLAATVFSCRPTPGPQPPSPPPPSPSPSPVVGAHHPYNPPLKVAGSRFTDKDGKPADIMQFGTCCYFQEWPDYRADLQNQGQTPGYNKWATPRAMITDAADAGFNMAIIRVGPWWNPFQGGLKNTQYYRAYNEVDGKADLDHFRADFWAHKKADVDYLTSLRMYIEIGLIDVWAFKNDGVIGPWFRDFNIQHFTDRGCDSLLAPPTAYQQSWVRKTVATLGYAPNVIWEIGNETFGCEGNITNKWEIGIVNVIRDEETKRGYIRHLVGSNAAPTIPDTHWADYQNFHERTVDLVAQAKKLGRPVAVNEVNPNIWFKDWSAYTQNAMKNGLHYIFWLSDSNDANITSALAEARRIRTSQGY